MEVVKYMIRSIGLRAKGLLWMVRYYIIYKGRKNNRDMGGIVVVTSNSRYFRSFNLKRRMTKLTS